MPADGNLAAYFFRNEVDEEPEHEEVEVVDCIGCGRRTFVFDGEELCSKCWGEGFQEDLKRVV